MNREKQMRVVRDLIDRIHKKTRDRADYSLKLDYNELPYSPKWLGNMDGKCLYSLNRYPEEENQVLIENIAETYSILPSEVAVTHGVDEALDRFIQLFSQSSFVLFRPTFYGFSDRLAALSVSVRYCDLSDDFRISESDLSSLEKTDIVILASPNNPTGHLFDNAEIEKLLDTAQAVLIDETYIDFSSSAGWLSKRPDNLFVYRSFSKSFGLAGLRAGFLVGPSDKMEEIRKKQWFCNISSPVIAAINQALDSDWHIHKANEIIQERVRVFNTLQGMSFELLATETNFLLLKDSSGIIGEMLDRNSIRVKSLDNQGMPSYLRISIESPINNDLLISTLATVSSSCMDINLKVSGNR